LESELQEQEGKSVIYVNTHTAEGYYVHLVCTIGDLKGIYKGKIDRDQEKERC